MCVSHSGTIHKILHYMYYVVPGFCRVVFPEIGQWGVTVCNTLITNNNQCAKQPQKIQARHVALLICPVNLNISQTQYVEITILVLCPFCAVLGSATSGPPMWTHYLHIMEVLQFWFCSVRGFQILMQCRPAFSRCGHSLRSCSPAKPQPPSAALT